MFFFTKNIQQRHINDCFQMLQKQMEHLNFLWIGLLLITLNLIILILLGNVTVIVCVFQFKRLQTAANYIIVSLAITDILLAFCLPLPFFENWTGIDSYFGLLSNHVQATASGTSIITISIIAYDRYSAVSNPLSYKTEMTKRKILYFIGFAWFYSAIISWTPFFVGWRHDFSFGKSLSLQLFLQNTYTLQLIAVFTPSCCIILFCYIHIYCIARHHSLAIAALEMSLKSNRQIIIRNTKYSKTIFSIIGTFLSLWLPFQIGVFLMNTTNIHITYTIWKSLHYLAFFNSVLNPWVYALKTSNFQCAFKQIYNYLFKSKNMFVNKHAGIISATNCPLESVMVVPVYQTVLHHSYRTKKFLLRYQERKSDFSLIRKWSPSKLTKQLIQTLHLQTKNKRPIYSPKSPIKSNSFIL